MNLKILLLPLAVGLLGACSTLPSSGPTGDQIEESVQDAAVVDTGLDIEIVTVDSVAALPPDVGPMQWTLPVRDAPPTDMIGPGDVLSISIFEVGVSLFGGDSGPGLPGGGGFDPSASVQTLPPSRVDDDGEIVVPYVGRLRVVGKTVGEVQDQIRNGLRNLSQDPQVLITREQVIGNSVIIGGEVAQPGRLVLETNQESMADAIALAGGYRGNAKDLVLRVTRGENEARVRLSDVLAGVYENPHVYPGDRLTVLADPMSFSVLGASGRVQQMPFATDSMTVAEAMSVAGGPAENAGDPEAVFLFRYAGPDNTQPVVYHFNMMNTATYFLAQQFAMRNGDILYFGNAAANQPRKLIQAISQLFAPVVTATSVANNVGN